MAASETVTLERATSETDPLLRNLLELYVHDMSEVFPVELGSDGRFGYEKLPHLIRNAWRRAGSDQ